MSLLEMRCLTHDNLLDFYLFGKVREVCQGVTLKLETGNVYCLDCGLSTGGWAISWSLTGKLKRFTSVDLDIGKIYFDGIQLSDEQIKALGCSVGLTGFEGTFSAKKPIGKLFEKVIKKSPRVKSIKELQDIFLLSEGRFDRGIRYTRNERWGITIAMGYARGSRVFGFHWMRPEYIIDNKDIWIKRVIKPLLQEDCVVIIPTTYRDDMKDLFTKVVKFSMPHGTIRGEPTEIIDLPDSYK